VGVLSGNRNFDGRVNPHLGAAYLASPALVVAYALAGDIACDLASDALGRDAAGEPVYLRDIWPDDAEIRAVMAEHLGPQSYATRYRDVWQGSPEWQAIAAPSDVQFPWDQDSDYIRRPPYFDGFSPRQPAPLALAGARPFMMLGDNVTTDHISPAGAIPAESLAGRHLAGHGVPVALFNQYATRRSNHEVMLRGAFSNPRLVNELQGMVAQGTATCLARAADGSGPMTAYEAAQSFRALGIPLVLLAGKNYGAGSSRDWAAKASALLGVRAVIAESFERIHRSNLIGMGVSPLLLPVGLKRGDLCRDGSETLSFDGLDALASGRNRVVLTVRRSDGSGSVHELVCQMDSQREIDTLRHGGILPYVVRGALSA
jgi:aconitate hydratase